MTTTLTPSPLFSTSVHRNPPPVHPATARSERGDTPSALDLALRYAACGWQVFPLASRTKVPLANSKGFYEATANPQRIKRWFGEGFPYNIGIRTGLASH